jgi:hypothetical protein
MLTTSALYNRAQKVLRVRSSRAMKTSSSCELTPRVPSPPPYQLPPGPWTSLASSALCLDCLHANPSTTSVDQRAEACPYPTTVRLSGCRLRPTSSKGVAKRRVKSGNFNWFYRQFYYALNTSPVSSIFGYLSPEIPGHVLIPFKHGIWLHSPYRIGSLWSADHPHGGWSTHLRGNT